MIHEFPDWIENRRSGQLRNTVGEIVGHIGVKRAQPSAEPASALVPGRTASGGRRSPQLTLDEIAHPSYMVNYNFELTWYNETARRDVFGFAAAPHDSEARNIFPMLLHASGNSTARRDDLLRLHLSLAKPRLSKACMQRIAKGLDAPLAMLIEELYDQTDTVTAQASIEVPFTLHGDDGRAESWVVYGIYFREGILIVHTPTGQAEPGLLAFFARRDVLIRSLLRKRHPVLMPLAVLVADLQNSVKICSELPPAEYFELINEVWSEMAPIFRKYYGTNGKHVGDGMVYYFFPQPDSNYVCNAMLCAQEVKLAMRNVSRSWKLRKNWHNDLYLNIGLQEGKEYLGTFQTATSVEFAVLGDTINHAARLSDFAREGAIWATKNVIGKLTLEERARIEYGVTRRAEGDREHFVPATYSQLGALVDLESGRHEKLREISTLLITEVRSVEL